MDCEGTPCRGPQTRTSFPLFFFSRTKFLRLVLAQFRPCLSGAVSPPSPPPYPMCVPYSTLTAPWPPTYHGCQGRYKEWPHESAVHARYPIPSAVATLRTRTNDERMNGRPKSLSLRCLLLAVCVCACAPARPPHFSVSPLPCSGLPQLPAPSSPPAPASLPACPPTLFLTSSSPTQTQSRPHNTT
jgi:hypothetical protein